jgi:hypothetical protein
MDDTTGLDMTALFDTLLPGHGDWPAASGVLAGDALPEAAQPLARDLAARLAGLPPDAHVAALKDAETAKPDAFAELYHAVADAYYASPEVAGILWERAAAGPPDPSGPVFDRRLLDGVVAGQRGRRRL